ncbi:CapA family protein [Natronoglycomyces albus]|uniref:CapA family protein n=1 Tax=Natronoglycomyces albus TaxID=2811108 RepID=A0A895XRB9_9ACTN|nr:CapA family protein [Natronoglycomyces albus]QSB04810.1 CapA family protein [Natronoglycomyces albus]
MAKKPSATKRLVGLPRQVAGRIKRRLLGSTSSSASTSSKTIKYAGERESLDLLIVGDTSFGENYQESRELKGRTNILKDRGYEYCLEAVAPLMDKVDLVVANLETPLTTREKSPLEGMRPWLHKSDPTQTIKHLSAHKVGAVKLANNHSADYGEEGLLDTLNALAANGIPAVGAGRTLKEAQEPLQVQARLKPPAGEGEPEKFRMRLFNAYQGGRQFTETVFEHADTDRPGSAPLKAGSLARRIHNLKDSHPHEFVVVCPHWRRDYQWRSEKQATAAAQLMNAGADLIIGHGSHMMQEIEKIHGSWVIHGIGNFVFNSPGRYRKLEVPPYGLAARLTFSYGSALLRLYPIMLDNRRSNYQTRPVHPGEFKDVVKQLTQRCNEPDSFAADFGHAEDEIGWHLVHQLRAPQ